MINVMFVLCSLPIVTIGASLCALYAMCIKLVYREDGSIARGFLEEFKKNFKQGTVAWLITLFAFAAIWGELFYIVNFGGTMGKVYTVVVVIEIMAVALILPFLYPLIARYENTMWNTIRNAFLLAVSNFGKWLKIFLAWFAPIALSVAEPKVFFNTWYLWLLIAFGLIGYGTSHSLLAVFERVSEVKEEKVEQAKKEQEEVFKSKKYRNISKRANMGVDADKDENE